MEILKIFLLFIIFYFVSNVLLNPLKLLFLYCFQLGDMLHTALNSGYIFLSDLHDYKRSCENINVTFLSIVFYFNLCFCFYLSLWEKRYTSLVPALPNAWHNSILLFEQRLEAQMDTLLVPLP